MKIEQYETVSFDTNLNPLGIPDSVKRAIQFNIGSVIKYPEIYYPDLKSAVMEYTGAPLDTIITGNGFSDLIRLFTALISPKKALILTPCATDYEAVLTSYGCEIDFYQLDEGADYTLDMADLIRHLDSSLDMIVIGNPNNPTSRKIPGDEIEMLADACKTLNIFLLIDEMYLEFTETPKEDTAIPLTRSYSNLTVIRSVSKFFAVPGLRFAYAVMNNPDMKKIIDLTTTKNSIASLSAIAVTQMLKDRKYIDDSRSLIHTERNLVYMAMSTSQNIHLTRPDANFMLMKILKSGVTSADIAEHCNQRGLVIRRCDDFRGLGENYIRFCFMNPKQNDLCVNTILEML